MIFQLSRATCPLMSAQVRSRAVKGLMKIRIFNREPLLRSGLKNTVITRGHYNLAYLCPVQYLAKELSSRHLDGVSSAERVSVHEDNGAVNGIFLYTQ